jgi:hypothetical protein
MSNEGLKETTVIATTLFNLPYLGCRNLNYRYLEFASACPLIYLQYASTLDKYMHLMGAFKGNKCPVASPHLSTGGGGGFLARIPFFFIFSLRFI